MPILLGELIVPAFAFLGALVLLGLSQTHTAQHGSGGISGFLQWIAHGGPVVGLLKLANAATRFVVSHFAAAQLRMVAGWFKALGTLALFTFSTMADTADLVERALRDIYHYGDRVARAEAKAAKALAREASSVAHRAVGLAKADATALRRYEAKVNAEVRRIDRAVTVTLPHDIARVRGLEEDLSRDLAKLRKRTVAIENGAVKTFEWIRAHPLSGATAVFTGAVAVALARMGFGFLRCRNWQSLGKSLTCGMGKWILDSLELIAGLALGTFAVLDPEALAESAVAAVDAVEPILARILAA